MSAKQQTNTAQITVLCTEDSTSNVLVNRSFSPALDAVAGVYGTYWAQPSGVTGLLFPLGLAVAYNFFIRNLGAVGAGSISCNMTMSGAGSLSVVLGPGDVWLLWGNSNSLTIVNGLGIVGISVGSAAGVGVPFEYFIGG